MTEQLERHQAQDIFYLAWGEVQILMCFLDNGDKNYAAPGHKGWLTKKQAQEWVKRRYGELIEPRPLNALKPSRKLILATVTALNATIKELEFALLLRQGKFASRKTKNALKAVENMQELLEAEKERLAIVRQQLTKAA